MTEVVEDEAVRAARLLAAQGKAVELFEQIEARGLIRAGVGEVAVGTEVRDLAADLSETPETASGRLRRTQEFFAARAATWDARFGDDGPAYAALHLPLADRSVDAVFAAGLINHLPDPYAGLRELARITRRPGRLILFHPSGRAALAARHGRQLRPDEPLDPAVLRPMLSSTGWRLTRCDDAIDKYFALAVRHARRKAAQTS